MKRIGTNRRGTYRPHLEPLESRMQPGSILTSGVDLALFGSTLDYNTLGVNDRSTAGTSFARPRAWNLGLGSGHAGTVQAAGGHSVAPDQVHPSGTVATSSLTLSTGSSPAWPATVPITAAPVVRVPTSPSVVNHTVDTGGVSSSHAAANLTPVALAAPQPVPVAAPTVTPLALSPLANAQGSTQGGQDMRHARHSHPLVSNYWLSYVGGPGEDALSKVAVTGTGNGAALYAAGWTTDPADGQTLQIELIKTTNNATTAPKVYRSPSSPGNNAQAYAVDLAHNELRSSGNIIVAGYVSNAGVQNLVVESIKSDLTAVNWAVTSRSRSEASVIYGVKSVGGAVYFTGADNGNLMVGKLDAATGDPIYANVFSFVDENGNALASVGNGIGVDSTGKTDVALKLTTTDGTDLPTFAQVTADGQTAAALSYGSTGPGGSLNAIQVDSAGSAYYSGVSYATDESYDGYSYLVVSKIAADGQTQLYGNLYALDNQAGQHVFNWVGYDNKLDTARNVTMATTYDDGNNAVDSYGQWVLKIDAQGNAIDQGDGGVRGMNSDYAYGVAIGAGGQIWEVGKTTSPDLNANGFQTMYGGGPSDGWIAGFTSP